MLDENCLNIAVNITTIKIVQSTSCQMVCCKNLLFYTGGEWQDLLQKNTPEPEAYFSLFNLKPKTEYQFRVIALNSRGISAPSKPSEFSRTLGWYECLCLGIAK